MQLTLFSLLLCKKGRKGEGEEEEDAYNLGLFVAENTQVFRKPASVATGLNNPLWQPQPAK